MTTLELSSTHALACVALTVTLIASLVIWQFSAMEVSALRLAMLGALAAPLVAAVPGLLKRKVYTARWASLLTIVYIGLGLMETTVNPEARGIASALAGVSFALFGALILAIRRARRV